MFLIQILLPLSGPDGRKFDDEQFRRVRDDLTQAFGGVTAYLQAPAQGVWQDGQQRTSHDEIVLVEVMVETLDLAWWHDYRVRLEATFQQQELVVRAHEITRL